MKQKTLLDKYKAIQAAGYEVDIPWDVMRVLNSKKLSVMANEVSLNDNGDYVSLQHARESLDWLVDQLGGKIEWSK